jgi:hypothetical protein
MDTENGLLTEKQIAEAEMIRWVIKIVAGVLTAVVVVIGGCTVHSHQYDEARMRATAEQRLADAEYVRAQSADEIAQTEAIERLINQGVDPIAARCAIVGSRTDDPKCIAAGAMGKRAQ